MGELEKVGQLGCVRSRGKLVSFFSFFFFSKCLGRPIGDDGSRGGDDGSVRLFTFKEWLGLLGSSLSSQKVTTPSGCCPRGVWSR